LSQPQHHDRPTVLVVDFGAQYAQLIARRVRELKVYSEIVPHRITAAEVAERKPAAIMLSGGPKSVHVEGAPSLDVAIYDLGVPCSASATALSSSDSNSAVWSAAGCRASTAGPG
jgi:carbamoylphosphate synthase small subunit